VARIPLVEPDTLTPEQRRVYDRIVAGPRRAVVGPLRAVLHNPELAEHWQQLGALVRYRTTLPARLKEIAILATARRWNADLEWQIHEAEARTAGVPDAVIAAIRGATAPPFADPAERDVYEFVRALQETGRVPDACYRAVHDRHGTLGVVELTALVGYYTMVAMTLNAHEIALPAGAAGLGPPLPAVGPDDRLTACARAEPSGARPAGEPHA
jgi:4-carboxymuconolactone decarboxylase